MFLGILLALILTATLDAFFKDIPQYGSLAAIVRVAKSQLSLSVLLFCQLLVFVFTVIRFYWGTVRYHEEISDGERTSHFLFGFIGELAVFCLFYVTALVVKHPPLFYATFGLAFVVDFLWFFVASRFVTRSRTTVPKEMYTLWSWYLLFDLLTIIPLALFIAVAHYAPCTTYLCQMLSLSVIGGIGIWDVWLFRAFYTKDDWKRRLPRPLFTAH